METITPPDFFLLGGKWACLSAFPNITVSQVGLLLAAHLMHMHCSAEVVAPEPARVPDVERSVQGVRGHHTSVRAGLPLLLHLSFLRYH